MDTKKANEILKDLLKKIDTEDIDFPTWRNLTASSLRVIFPISYEQKEQNLLKLKYELSVMSFVGSDENRKLKEKAIGNAKGLLNIYLEEINSHGIEKLEKPQEENRVISLIKNPVFWSVIVPAIGASIYLGTTIGTLKYDSDKINLFEQKRALDDTVKVRENTIRFMRHNSDSALNILGHMPYDEMKLDAKSFRKVQTNIENAGAVLYLNK
jgi:hypothetical protein